MKGDKFVPGDRVILRNFRDNGFTQINNKPGVVRRLINAAPARPGESAFRSLTALDPGLTKEPMCQPYEIEMGNKVTLIACACNMDRAEPNKPLDWAWKIAWANCAWQPNMSRLSLQSQTYIQNQIRRKKP